MSLNSYNYVRFTGFGTETKSSNAERSTGCDTVKNL